MKKIVIYGDSELEVLRGVSFALSNINWQIYKVIFKDLEQAKSLYRIDADIVVVYAHPDEPKIFIALQNALKERNIEIVSIY